MYVCIKCGTPKKPGEDRCKCGSTVFVRYDKKLKKRSENGNRKINHKKTKTIENIKIVRKGVFLINLDALTKKENLIIKDEKGIYYIHIPVRIQNIPDFDKP
ncbi:hypothetical protein J7J26_02290 [Candidatus Micrarchaeota archaeon]|nr:hypothetical protein [Candidatus Micrarchaeota archaeon]